MYKVFIDHRPVLFISKEELSTKYKSISWDESNLTFKKIEKKLEGIDIDSPLQVICEDVKAAYRDCFLGFKKITAGGGIVESEHGFLLIKRKGMWDLPKGKKDKGEEIEQTAIREIEEECGITSPTINQFICKTIHSYSYKNNPVLKKTHWFHMSYAGNEELIPQRDEGITKVGWKSYEKMMSMRGKTFGSINEVLDQFKERKTQ
ncbi:MAG: NUDIX domain-containing protein [Crocinitomicaceae bacterium]